MNINTKLVVIALAVTSLALAPSLMINNSADATGWCANQKKPSNWIYGCQNGWYDHDHCNPYTPGNDGQYTEGYKVGWKRGSC